MYPMLSTQLDLAYAIRALGRHTANPGEEHKWALDWVFCYLQATKDWHLTYQHGAPEGLTLTGFVDADWANELSDRSSTSGYVYQLAGGAISWSSKKQLSIALSSTEAEYIAGVHATKEVVWLRQLLAELGLLDDDPTILHIDNQSAMAIAKNPQFYDRTKHIEVWHHFLCHKVEDGEIRLEYVPTGDQVADALIKGLNQEKHNKFAREMGLCHLVWGGMLEGQTMCGSVDVIDRYGTSKLSVIASFLVDCMLPNVSSWPQSPFLFYLKYLTFHMRTPQSVYSETEVSTFFPMFCTA